MEKHWKNATDGALRELVEKPRLGLVTDVDGTLSPIVDTPDAAQVTPRNKELLASLVDQLTLVAVITGRAVTDVRERVAVPGIVYVGNHGLERWQGGEVVTSPEIVQYRPALQAVLMTLNREALPGMFIEDKAVTISVHYRQAENPDTVIQRFRPLLHELAEEHGLRVFEGRMLFEVRPPVETNKGSALRHLVQEYNLDAALYLGDDTTDVDALKVARELRDRGECYAFGMGVVSEGTPDHVLETADFLLEGVSGVEDFLSWLVSARRASSS